MNQGQKVKPKKMIDGSMSLSIATQYNINNKGNISASGRALDTDFGITKSKNANQKMEPPKDGVEKGRER